MSLSIFWIFFAGLILFALYTVLVRRIIHATLGLMAVLMQSAVLYLMLGAEFIAGIQILVYVGGIVILIVYIVMLTRSTELTEPKPSGLRKIIGGIITLTFWALAVRMIGQMEDQIFKPSPEIPVSQLGRLILSSEPGGYLVAFEVVSVLLLACVIGAVVIARKRKEA